jgi:hypothetical protein
MANICKNIITVIGLRESPEAFAKALAKVVFGIDLDNLDPNQWGENSTVEAKDWYGSLVEEYRREGAYAARYCIPYPQKPLEKCGVTLPRYYVETKWKSPFDEIRKASEMFPQLVFHVDWLLLQDGPKGEYVMRGGEAVEGIQRGGSRYLFDPLLHPSLSLLSAHMPFTLAQHGAQRVGDAIGIIEQLRGILDDKRFVESPYQDYRDMAKLGKTRETLDSMLDQMKDAAKTLDFQGVLITD